MKKNKTMRAASFLLVLTLMTSCFVGSTFAKYTTTVSGTDQARVAYWGFEPVSMDINGLFENVYDATVNAQVNVIAPGTSGSDTFAFAYAETANVNAPEVSYSFKVSTDGSSCAQSIQDNSNIQWSLDNNTWGTWTQLITAIEKLDGDETYSPGELPTAFTAADDVHTISWRWLFDSSVAGATNVDATDTEMGNADDLAKVVVKITITAEQID